MLQIHSPSPAEFETARRILKEAHLDPTTPLHPEYTLVAEIEGKVVGVGQIKHLPGCQELGSLVVLPGYRGQGIAAQLIAALEEQAERPLYLMCLDQMTPYYARFGYQQITYREAPAFLKLKLLGPAIGRLFGLRVRVMRKD